MATTVYQGGASIDERGKATGGAAGDQTGAELRIRPWYKHSKGWIVIRAKDSTVRAKLATAMRAACNNPKIGYDQYQRDTLYNVSKPLGFDPGKVTTRCECDCSSLVRVCCAYAGIAVGNIRTTTEPAMLKATGKFDLLTAQMYTDRPDYLLAGDILCTKESGHTVIILNNGDLATVPPLQNIRKTVTVGSLYVRKGPGIFYRALRTVHKGDILVATGKTSGTWTEIIQGAGTAWVSSKYIK